ncbi:MAG: hypothetical protein ACE5KH_05490 [Candidatus Geothermarchaeales archaeon]
MKETEKAWLVYARNTDGSIFITKYRSIANRGLSYRPSLTVTNTNEPFLRRVKEIIGAGSADHIPELREAYKGKFQ